MADRFVLAGIAGESLSNRKTTKLGTGLWRARLPDGGWERVEVGLPTAPEVRALAVAGDGATVYAGLQDGVYRSDDEGRRWRRLPAPAPRWAVWSLAVHPRDSRVVFAGYEPGGVWMSDDGGAHWTEARYAVEHPAAAVEDVKRVMALAVDADAARVFGAVEVGGPIRSLDGGRTFAAAPGDGDADACDLHGIGVLAGGAVCTAGRLGIDRSDDGGATWRRVAGDGFVIRGVDGAALEAVVASVGARYADNLCVARQEALADGALSVALGARRPGRRGYGGPFSPDAPGARRDGEGREVAAACWHAHRDVIAALLDAAPSVEVATAFARFDGPAPFERALGDTHGAPCRCSRDDGADAPETRRRVAAWMMAEPYCRAVAATPGDARRVYVGGGPGYLGDRGSLYRSDDAGLTWRALPVSTDIVGTVYGVAIDPESTSRLVWGTRRGVVYHSVDGGESSTAMPLPAGADPIYCVALG